MNLTLLRGKNAQPTKQQTEESIEALNKCLEICNAFKFQEASKFKELTYHLHINLGYHYCENKKYDLALAQYEKAIELMNEENHNHLEDMALTKINEAIAHECLG